MSQEVLYVFAPKIYNQMRFEVKKGINKIAKIAKFKELNENDQAEQIEQEEDQVIIIDDPNVDAKARKEIDLSV